MKNFFNERRMIFFAGGGAECAGDNGMCLPENVKKAPVVAEADVDSRVDKASERIESSVRKVADKLHLETRVMTNKNGQMEFSLNDSSGETRFQIEMNGGTKKIRVTEVSVKGNGDSKEKVTEFASMSDALASIPETDFGHRQQLSALGRMTGLGIEGIPDGNGGYMAVFTDRKSGDRAFTVWNNADKTQFVLVKNTPTGGANSKPHRGDRMDTLIRDHLDDVWKPKGGERIAKK